jgi:hypothetical protein
MTPDEFQGVLRQYCNATGGSTTSGGRTPAHNKAVGGVPDSAHILWTAADVVYDAGMKPDPARDAIAARLGLMLIHEGDHDHVQAKR